MSYTCIERVSSYEMLGLLSKPAKIVLSAQPGRTISAYICLYSSIQLKVSLLHKKTPIHVSVHHCKYLSITGRESTS